eukprot:TRINITY_DN10946_c0_g1_i1.p1 TRINITY_DN10946_c0_g1~~TRINITY_DN10946_c0_g1_i1.p1  ORF type:complete len:335 (+),score=41.79 TRINITY_DN10946_c0_g1_i1:101-1006(+)
MERVPILFLSHGGGPCWFMGGNSFVGANRDSQAAQSMRNMYTENIAKLGNLKSPPKAIVVLSAHWESDDIQVTSSSQPELLYDNYGFPPETYAPALTYPCPGDAELSKQIVDMLTAAGFSARGNADRGLDHGVFIPTASIMHNYWYTQSSILSRVLIQLMFPKANIPVLQVSLKKGLDAKTHFALGQALRPLRDEGVLLIASGQATHNMHQPRGQLHTPDWALEFEGWLDAVAMEGLDDEAALTKVISWRSAPGGELAHPREEHLVPFFVAMGTRDKDDKAHKVLDGWMAKHFSLASYLWV